MFSSSFEIRTKHCDLPAAFQFHVGLILLQHVFDLLGGSLIVQMFGRVPAGVKGWSSFKACLAVLVVLMCLCGEYTPESVQ